MREILFRGKRIDTGEWAYGVPVPVRENTYPVNVVEMVEYVNYDEMDNMWPDYSSVDVDPETLGQYTGLTDQNGRKIFEGDILSVEFDVQHPEEGEPDKYYERAVVIFSKPYAGWLADYGYDTLYMSEYISPNGESKCAEIISNIHDNPELLKGGEGE